MPEPRIDIISEDLLVTTPTPGTMERTVAITYQIRPLPPSVAWIRIEDLADWVWRDSNRDQARNLPPMDKVPKTLWPSATRPAANVSWRRWPLGG